MPQFNRALDELGKKIADLKEEINATGKEANTLSTYMRIDPTNIQLVTDKWENLRKKLDAAKELQKKYAEKEKELKKEMEGKDTKSEEYKKLKDELVSTERAADKLKKTIDDLNKRFEIGQDKAEIAKTKANQLKERFDQLEKAAQKVARAVAVVTGAIVAFAKKSLDAAENVYSLSKSYGISAENLQLYGKALENATGQANLYTQSLKAMSTGLAQAAAGRGVAYSQALRNIGLSAQQLATLSREDAYTLIFQQLQQVSNATERASAAQVLFGESGLYIAEVAGQGEEAWKNYLAQAERYGIITTEQAEKAHQLNQEFSVMKSQLQAAGVQLAVSFAPMIRALTPMIEDFAGFIENVGNSFEKMGQGGQTAVVVLVLLIMALPKIIALVQGLSTAFIGMGAGAETAAGGMATLSASGGYVLLIIGVVAAAIIALCALFGAFRKESKETADSVVDDWGKTSDALKNAGFDASTAVEQYSYENTERVVNINVDITGKGDTAISDAAASTVAILTVDEINKRLGELTK